MIPQIRHAPPTEENTYTILHNYDAEQLFTFMYDGLTMAAGIFVGTLISGVAVTLGVSSVLLLSSEREPRSRRHHFLCTYSIILLFLLVAFEVQALVNYNTPTIFYFQSRSGVEQYGTRLARAFFLTLVTIAGLTDGLLAWRCFLVQRALCHGPSKWGNIFWVFPACLWVVTIVTATIAGVSTESALYTTSGILAFASNIVLNVYATLFITTRLFLHRRMVLACVRDKKLAAQHIYIIGILLESAAINLPVTIVAAVGIGNNLETVMLPVATASQVLAAILIIYQTALGRVFSRRKEAEISRMVEKRDSEHNISENMEPESTI